MSKPSNQSSVFDQTNVERLAKENVQAVEKPATAMPIRPASARPANQGRGGR